MSSFRIDRQYVSFVSAEAHSVVGRRSETEAAGNGVGSDARLSLEESRRQAEQLKAKLLKEAEEEAALLLREAQAEAERIAAEADKKAAVLIGEARDRAEQIKSRAQAEGYAEGLKNAQKAAEAKKAEDKASLLSMQASLRDSYSALVEGMRGEILSLVFGVVKKIINVKLDESDEVFLNMARDALEELKRAATVTIRVSPEDYDRYFGTDRAEGLADGGRISVVVEEDFRRGDLVAESDGEILDYSIGRQLERLEKAFREAGNV